VRRIPVRRQGHAPRRTDAERVALKSTYFVRDGGLPGRHSCNELGVLPLPDWERESGYSRFGCVPTLRPSANSPTKRLTFGGTRDTRRRLRRSMAHGSRRHRLIPDRGMDDTQRVESAGVAG
jgi:hypothetical protein